MELNGSSVGFGSSNSDEGVHQKLAEEIEKSIGFLREAAAKIDPARLADFLAECERTSYVPECEPMEFYFQFKSAFDHVSFPWAKMLNKSPLSTLIDFPLSHIPQPVYETSANWIKQRQLSTLNSFVVTVFQRFVIAMKHDTCSEPEVPTFVATAIILRARPDALADFLPLLREIPLYKRHVHDRLPLHVWMMAQASQGDLSAGLYAWAHNLLPLVVDMNNCCSPKSLDLILQLVENILSNPEAPTILVNGAVTEEGERVIPPPSFEILLRLTFPASSARVKTTERFEAIYPLLKEVALAPESARGSNAMEQIFTFSLKLTGQGNHVLAKEATSIAIWSLTENLDCFKHWDFLYKENLEASVALLKNLADKWKDHFPKLSLSRSDTLTLNRILKSFRRKNLKAITEGEANCSLYKEADKSCKAILGRLSRGSGGLILTTITTAVVVGAAAGAAATALVLYPPVGVSFF